MDVNEIEGAARGVKGKVKETVGTVTDDQETQLEGKFDQYFGTAQRQFGAVVDQARKGGEYVAGAASDLSQKAAESAAPAIAAVRDQASDLADRALDAKDRAGQVATTAVTNQPLLALFGAAALGYLVAFAIHSRPRE